MKGEPGGPPKKPVTDLKKLGESSMLRLQVVLGFPPHGNRRPMEYYHCMDRCAPQYKGRESAVDWASKQTLAYLVQDFFLLGSGPAGIMTNKACGHRVLEPWQARTATLKVLEQRAYALFFATNTSPSFRSALGETAMAQHPLQRPGQWQALTHCQPSAL
eukprot:1146809-Pelagomonas_calceolata.AAC.2